MGLLVIAIVATIGIVNFVNPNQFKDTIERTVSERTGHELNIRGPITWRWFPILALQLEDVVLKNRTPFTGHLLSAKIIGAKCELEPLLLGKIALDIQLKGLDLMLSKNAKGQTNWAELKQRLATPDTANTSSARIGLNGIMVQNGQVTLVDDTKQSHYVLNHVNISAEHLLKGAIGISNPFSLSFELGSHQQPIGHLSLESEWSLKQGGESIHFQNIAFEFKLPNGHITHLHGAADIQNLKRIPTVQGHLAGDAIQIGKIKIDALKANFVAKGGLIHIAPIDIKIAHSQQKATLKIDLSNDTPKYFLTQEAQDFEINHLLALFGKKDKLEGKTRLKMNLSATGSSVAEWQRSLSGQGEIEIRNGKFHGIDLIHLGKNAQSRVHGLVNSFIQKLSINPSSALGTEAEKWKTTQSSSIFTPFETAKGRVMITNGVVRNPDLAISHPEYAINGAGTVQLSNNTIQYQTSFLLKNNPYPENNKIGRFLYQTPLTIQISGTLNDPVIRPDMTSYFGSALSFAQKQVVETVVEKVLTPENLNKALEHLLNR